MMPQQMHHVIVAKTSFVRSIAKKIEIKQYRESIIKIPLIVFLV